MAEKSAYFIPKNSPWPIVGSIGVFCLFFGLAHWFNHPGSFGEPLFAVGVAIVIFMMVGWFRAVVLESTGGSYNAQVDSSFRMGMVWFIFSEVLFFGAFFGALFYGRILSVPWMGGHGDGVLTHAFIWPDYTASWPTNGPGEIGGAFEAMNPWGLALLNTVILLTSSATVTVAHHALNAGHRTRLKVFLGITALLGICFLISQAFEYHEAYTHMNLTLHSGIYGSTFFMLTGFHGAHVTVGTIMLIVIWARVLKGHFNGEHQFGFEAVTWYWHFVDVVWLCLFTFVYVL